MMGENKNKNNKKIAWKKVLYLTFFICIRKTQTSVDAETRA